MDTTVAPAGVIKRSRQACSGCRKKKIKCSGERPVCVNCRQASRGCIYEPYSNSNRSNNNNNSKPDGAASLGLQSAASLQISSELMQRISAIESMLMRLGGEGPDVFHQRADSVSSSDTSSRPIIQDLENVQLRDSGRSGSDATCQLPLTFDVLPPARVLSALVDRYFTRVHNQPYAYFHEESFRHRLECGSLPKSLQFAVLALAVRFSDHSYFRGRTQEASTEYSKQSWYLVLSDHLMALTTITLPVIQTMSLLALIDYTAGRVNEGWLKVGLAARLSQAIDLMAEPSPLLPEHDQEERRSTFWTIYIVDRLISCSRSRPPCISDDDVYVRLPCDQQMFSPAADRISPTLRPLLSLDTTLAVRPEGLTLSILMASILGHCTKYVHGRAGVDMVPPWDPKSDYTSANASLMLLESYFDTEKTSIQDLIRDQGADQSIANTQQLGHVIHARTLFYLCHCLLNHPSLLRIRLKAFTARVARSFSLRALQTAEENARRLTDLLKTAADGGVLLESSFYTYCVAVAGAIHSMACSVPRHELCLGQYDTQRYFQQSMDTIERLSQIWPMASNIAARLGTFHEIISSQQGFFDPSLLTSPLDANFEDLLWSVADYNTLAGTLAVSSPFPDNFFNNISSIPTPPLWDGATIAPASSSSLNLDVPDTDLFQGSGFVFGEDHRSI